MLPGLGKEQFMKRHRAALATAAVVAGVIAAGALAPGAQAWGDECPPGMDDGPYCEHVRTQAARGRGR